MFRKATLATAILATTIAVAACGGSSPTNTTTPKTASKNASLKLSECMRTHGVPQFPDIGGNGSVGIQASANGNGATISVDGHTLDVSGPAFNKAMSECSKYGPKGPAISGSQLAKIKQGALKMASCMRSHGVPNFPDPVVTAGPGGHGVGVRIGGPSSGGGRLDPTSPAFEKAQKICGGLLGGPRALSSK
jgi:hypothetical protein